MENQLKPVTAEPVVHPTSVPELQQSDTPQQKPMLKSFSNKPKRNVNPLATLLVIGLVVILAGVGTGYAIAQSGGTGSPSSEATPSDTNLEANEAGISDESQFEEDAPEGILVEGGLNGEGTHHIDRNAGPDKMVYLTSAVINLDNFVGKKVKVWGNTIAAQDAPWLMDVGKIKSLE